MGCVLSMVFIMPSSFDNSCSTNTKTGGPTFLNLYMDACVGAALFVYYTDC